MCNYAERTIDVSCHMTSSQTWWNCESVKNKHGQRECGNAIWNSVQTRGSVLRHLPVLPSRLSAKSQKLLDLCLGDKHPETSAAWTMVESLNLMATLNLQVLFLWQWKSWAATHPWICSAVERMFHERMESDRRPMLAWENQWQCRSPLVHDNYWMWLSARSTTKNEWMIPHHQ